MFFYVCNAGTYAPHDFLNDSDAGGAFFLKANKVPHRVLCSFAFQKIYFRFSPFYIYFFAVKTTKGSTKKQYMDMKMDGSLFPHKHLGLSYISWYFLESKKVDLVKSTGMRSVFKAH